jgi:hypothetical protein
VPEIETRRAGLVHLAGPAPGGVTAYSTFPAQGEEAVLTAQPIEKILAAVKVSVVALEHVCCCSGAIRDRPGCRANCECLLGI